jgi:Ca2+-binding EF-hand superfamily protein
MREVFQQLFEIRRVTKETKQIFSEKGIDFHKIFEKIDKEMKGFLTKENFYSFLSESMPEFREGDCQELSIFVKKCDLDNDGKVTFKDFYMFFSI